MTTARDICTDALKIVGVLGVGQSALAEDINDAFTTLTRMLAVWQSRRYLIPSLAELVIPGTGAVSYTIGATGDVVTRRPDNIEDAFVRLLAVTGAQIDYPLEILDSREDYDTIAWKSMQSWPQAVYYQPDYPLGRLFVWPVASTAYELHIFVKQTLAGFTTLDALYTLPPEYEEPIVYNLVGRLCLHYGIDMKPGVAALAIAGLNTIRTANAQVPRLGLPGAVLNQRWGAGAGFGIGIGGAVYPVTGGTGTGTGTGTGGTGTGTGGTTDTTFILGTSQLGVGTLGAGTAVVADGSFLLDSTPMDGAAPLGTAPAVTAKFVINQTLLGQGLLG